MFKIRLAAAAGCVATALTAAAVPALAETGAAVSASAATRQAVPQQADRQQRAEEPVICARIEVPARRVRPRICKTRAQWEREYGGLPTR
jgi:hypothetical protein